MEIVKVLGVGLIGVSAMLVLKSAKSDYAPLATVATGVVILISVMNAISDSVQALTDIAAKSGLSDGLYTGIFKIIGIGYLTEYSSGIAEDAGCKSIGEKMQLAGKIGIFLISLPMLAKLVETVGEMI